MNFDLDLLHPRFRTVEKGRMARQKLLRGAEILAKTTAVTYGPHGRTVLLDRMAGLLATKDGVTVAREVDLEDPQANMGCQILKDACIQVNNKAGDGTTSTAIVAAAILAEGHKIIVGGLDPISVVRGIQEAAAEAVRVVESMTVPVEDQGVLERVAMIASNGDEPVSKAMAEACMAVGRDGTILIEDGIATGIDLEFKDGMEIERGAASSGFLRNENERILEQPLVACIGAPLKTVDDVKSLMEEASQWPDNPLLVIALDISGDALTTMTLNDSQKVMACVAVQAPGFHTRQRDYLKDIAALAGADYIDPETGGDHTKWSPDWFGSFRKAHIQHRKSTLTAYDEATEAIQTRLAQIDAELRQATSEYDIDRCNERKAKLSGGLCVMKVGGVTEAEMKERRARIEDALGAVRAALEHGVVPGAATSYLAAAEALASYQAKADSLGGHRDEVARMAGWRLMAKALRKPLMVLAENAGQSGPAMAHRVLEARAKDTETGGWLGWDALANEIRDLGAAPTIIDPTAVVRAVIQTAASAAGTLLTVEASITGT